MSRVMHFEMGAEDPERALKFYSKVFGWTYERWGDQQYWLIRTGKQGTPGIDGAIQPRKEQLAPVVNTIVVEDIDRTAMLIGENGGTIIVPKMEVPKVGLLLYFKDTEGNISGVMQPYPME